MTDNVRLAAITTLAAVTFTIESCGSETTPTVGDDERDISAATRRDVTTTSIFD